jgi:endonuclease/exonuclease/phosphatase family metal-dependent hydrolase
MRRWSKAMTSAVAALALAMLGSPAGVPSAAATSPSGRAKPLTVMTRNIYVGADITRPVRAALGKTGPDALLALGHANHKLRAIVDRTQFPVRSRLLAAEIAGTRPDLIGLQEVATWRSGPLQLDQLGVPNATRVDYDYLALLLAALKERGMTYGVASAQRESDVEAPSFLGNPLTGTATDARDVRLTVRDVILIRQHAGLRVLDHGGARYQHRINLDLGGAKLSIIRGYAWADIRSGSHTFRFVTTHLESQNSDLALAQAAELMLRLATGPAKTILVCDCNTDPLNDSVRPGDTVPRSAAYRLITGTGGFSDEWLRQRHSPGPGWTSGLSELVNDPTAADFNHRIDFVFARNTRGCAISAWHGRLVGDSLADRDPATGLWPSDHAGVVLRLHF